MEVNGMWYPDSNNGESRMILSVWLDSWVESNTIPIEKGRDGGERICLLWIVLGVGSLKNNQDK